MDANITLHLPRTHSMNETEHLSGRNFGLSATEFEALLARLEAGDESLFERVFVKSYWKMVRRLQASHRAQPANAEDAVMNSLLDFRKILLARKVTYGNLEAYFSRMLVTNYLKKVQRNRETPTEHFSENLAAPDDAPQFSAGEMAAFKKAWDSLCEKCGAVLKGFYYDELPHHRIAELLGKRTDAVKQDKHRCIEKLRKNFSQLQTTIYNGDYQ